ncbi:unnamed protein product, partial [Mesorhabditis belari]|uniref:Uncharacterized protein n=1 Tax=Mesorhabditis belari TaxID=2138241 RepID=A0AAF3FE57_9BILA
MPTEKLFQRNWKRGVVYLFQLPRAGIIPSVSPFSLKLETWLRIVDIPYENISTEFKKTSSKGQVPFIEYNGHQYADTSNIIEFLIKEFHKENFDSFLSPLDIANRQAFHHLIEQSIVWATLANRSQPECGWMFTEKGLLSHFTGVKKFVAEKVIGPRFQKNLKSSTHTQGYGRYSIEELELIIKNDLTALDTFLGEKLFFFGDQPSTFDATAFGPLAQVFFTPLACRGVQRFAETNCKHLISWADRMKSRFWPDWNECTKSLSLDTTLWKESTRV